MTDTPDMIPRASVSPDHSWEAANPEPRTTPGMIPRAEAPDAALVALLVEAKEALQSSEESIVTFMDVHGYTKESGAQVILDQIRATLAKMEKTDD